MCATRKLCVQLTPVARNKVIGRLSRKNNFNERVDARVREARTFIWVRNKDWPVAETVRHSRTRPAYTVYTVCARSRQFEIDANRQLLHPTSVPNSANYFHKIAISLHPPRLAHLAKRPRLYKQARCTDGQYRYKSSLSASSPRAGTPNILRSARVLIASAQPMRLAGPALPRIAHCRCIEGPCSLYKSAVRNTPNLSGQ